MESIVRGHAHRLCKNVRDHEIRSYGCSVCAFSRTRKWTLKENEVSYRKKNKKTIHFQGIGSYHLVWSLFPEQHLRRNQVRRLSSSCIYLQPMSVLYLLGGLFPIKVFASHQGVSRFLHAMFELHTRIITEWCSVPFPAFQQQQHSTALLAHFPDTNELPVAVTCVVCCCQPAKTPEKGGQHSSNYQPSVTGSLGVLKLIGYEVCISIPATWIQEISNGRTHWTDSSTWVSLLIALATYLGVRW